MAPSSAEASSRQVLSQKQSPAGHGVSKGGWAMEAWRWASLDADVTFVDTKKASARSRRRVVRRFLAVMSAGPDDTLAAPRRQIARAKRPRRRPAGEHDVASTPSRRTYGPQRSLSGPSPLPATHPGPGWNRRDPAGRGLFPAEVVVSKAGSGATAAGSERNNTESEHILVGWLIASNGRAADEARRPGATILAASGELR